MLLCYHLRGGSQKGGQTGFLFPVPKPWPVGSECSVTLLRDYMEHKRPRLYSETADWCTGGH